MGRRLRVGKGIEVVVYVLGVHGICHFKKKKLEYYCCNVGGNAGCSKHQVSFGIASKLLDLSPTVNFQGTTAGLVEKEEEEEEQEEEEEEEDVSYA